MEVEDGVLKNVHGVKEADVNCVVLLPKLDDRVILDAQLIEGQTKVLTLNDQVGLAANE
jgi:hypothetical protein